jgi:hypothetical protein
VCSDPGKDDQLHFLFACSGEGSILSSPYKFSARCEKKKKDTNQSVLLQESKKVLYVRYSGGCKPQVTCKLGLMFFALTSVIA